MVEKPAAGLTGVNDRVSRLRDQSETDNGAAARVACTLGWQPIAIHRPSENPACRHLVSQKRVNRFGDDIEITKLKYARSKAEQHIRHKTY
jgi:hypothetical protein